MTEPPPKERALAVLTELLAVLALYALAVAFIRPSGNFPLDDDTYFGLPALEFARTGHFHLTIAPHSLRAQILWGALFVRLFGPTFDALHVASMVSLAIAIVMFHATLRRLPVARGVRLFATFAFAFHPLLFWSSFTFMTEAHFVCASVIAIIAGSLAAILGVRLLFAVPAAVANPRRDAAVLLAAGYVVAHTSALCASAAYFDRYALSSAWPVAVVLAIITPKRPLWKGAIAVLLLVAAFDVVAVDEYFAWQRARWSAWYDLQRQGVPVREIDAGNEPFDLAERAYADDVHSRRRMAFGPGPRRYSIAFQPQPEMRIIGRYPFRGWLGLHQGTIFVLERISGTSSTAAHD
ncbi:MAG: hypothetical protein QOC81_2421 [Thermoanaerobaculia bacterium]|jgi:hypothetical protein|nr:hypothetical protein [Thermoanaerobaculia bacterium]